MAINFATALPASFNPFYTLFWGLKSAHLIPFRYDFLPYLDVCLLTSLIKVLIPPF